MIRIPKFLSESMSNSEQQQFLKKLAEINSDDKQLKEIGKKVVQEAAKCAALDRLGLKVGQPMIEWNVKKGEIVPAELSRMLEVAGKDPIQVNPAGEAMWDWGAGWGLGPFWGQLWIDIGGASIDHPLFDPLNIRKRIHVENVFEKSEIKYLESIGVDIESF